MAQQEIRNFLANLQAAQQGFSQAADTRQSIKAAATRQSVLAGMREHLVGMGAKPDAAQAMVEQADNDPELYQALGKEIISRGLPNLNKGSLSAAQISTITGKSATHPDVQTLASLPIDKQMAGIQDYNKNGQFNIAENLREKKDAEQQQKQNYGTGFQNLTPLLTKAQGPLADIDNKIDQAKTALAKGSSLSDPIVQNAVARMIGGDKGRLAVAELSRWLPHTALGDIKNWESYFSSGDLSKLTDQQKAGWGGILDMAKDFNEREKSTTALNVVGTFLNGHRTLGAVDKSGELEPGLKNLADTYDLTFDKKKGQLVAPTVVGHLKGDDAVNYADAQNAIKRLPKDHQAGAQSELDSLATKGGVPQDFVQHLQSYPSMQAAAMPNPIQQGAPQPGGPAQPLPAIPNLMPDTALQNSSPLGTGQAGF